MPWRCISRRLMMVLTWGHESDRRIKEHQCQEKHGDSRPGSAPLQNTLSDLQPQTAGSRQLCITEVCFYRHQAVLAILCCGLS